MKTNDFARFLNPLKSNIMKKLLLAIIVASFSVISISAQLPYSKMMGLSAKELIEKNFKFDKKKNQYVLTKTDGLNTAANIFKALSGQAVTYQPSKKDYKIILQYGQLDSLSSLTVIFYSDETFNEIESWIAENNIQTISSAAGKESIQKFTYNGLNVELRTRAVIQSEGSATRSRYSGYSNSIDKSYTVYTYTIYTGVAPQSEFLTKEQSKKAKGGKEGLNDLF
jgi:hypothetical protein